MNNLANDSTKSVAVFINDFDQDYASALEKLSDRLGRPLRGLILLDKTIKQEGSYEPDANNVFEQIVCDFSSDASLHNALKVLEKNLLLVTNGAERNQLFMQRLIPHIPYVFSPTESSLTWATHKAKMREMLGSYNSSLVPAVQTVTNGSEAEIQKVINKLKFPLIVKPTGLASSVLVSRVRNETELRAAIKKSFAVLKYVYERDGGRGKPAMIAEEFIEGDMHSVDAYVNEWGKVWILPLLRSKTAYEYGQKDFYVYQEESHLELSAKDIGAGKLAAEQAVHALGLRSCVAHIELFYTTDGWKIIELAARPGGQRRLFYNAAYGIDHTYNELLIKVGLPPEITSKPIAHSTIIELHSEKEGILTAVEGIEAAMAIPSTYNVKMSTKLGNRVAPSPDGGRVVIDAVLYNKDLQQLYRDTDLVRSTIKIVTQK